MRNIQNINIRYGSGVPVPCDPGICHLPRSCSSWRMRKGALPQGESLFFFLPHPSSPARIFSKITPVPSLPLKRGSTSPSAPSPQERAPTGKPAVLYSQTSSRPQGGARGYRRNRIAIVLRTMCDCLCAVGTDAQVSDYWLLMKKMGKSLVVWEIIRIFAAWIR